mmetsp:Transcript_37134/g.93193  ORF Transcript_37134/g.93193 Transcript_37134/m.93193 type:complete len:382 (+) Transcript_37134:94-1239(+)
MQLSPQTNGHKILAGHASLRFASPLTHRTDICLSTKNPSCSCHPGTECLRVVCLDGCDAVRVPHSVRPIALLVKYPNDNRHPPPLQMTPQTWSVDEHLGHVGLGPEPPPHLLALHLGNFCEQIDDKGIHQGDIVDQVVWDAHEGQKAHCVERDDSQKFGLDSDARDGRILGHEFLLEGFVEGVAPDSAVLPPRIDQLSVHSIDCRLVVIPQLKDGKHVRPESRQHILQQRQAATVCFDGMGDQQVGWQLLLQRRDVVVVEIFQLFVCSRQVFQPRVVRHGHAVLGHPCINLAPRRAVRHAVVDCTDGVLGLFAASRPMPHAQHAASSSFFRIEEDLLPDVRGVRSAPEEVGIPPEDLRDECIGSDSPAGDDQRPKPWMGVG